MDIVRSRDTKNIVKNIFKILLGWLEDHTSSELKLAQLMKTFSRDHGKYNNNLLLKVFRNRELRKAFLAFS